MVTEVNFYHLTRATLEEALPRLLAKTLQAGERAVVMLGSPERQPIWLTHLDENPNRAAFLFLADRARSERIADYRRCFELFDGRDETAVADTRERWKACKAAGHTVVYWQQTPTGSWEKKA